MIRLSHTLNSQKPALLCVAGNLFDPSVAFEHIIPPKNFQKLYVHYFDGPGPWDMETLGQELARLLEHFPLFQLYLLGIPPEAYCASPPLPRFQNEFPVWSCPIPVPVARDTEIPQFAQELKEHFNDETYIRHFLSSCFYHPIPKEVEDRLWEYTRTIPPEAGYEVSLSLRQQDYRESLKAYKGPAAIIHGQLDTRRKLDSDEMFVKAFPRLK